MGLFKTLSVAFAIIVASATYLAAAELIMVERQGCHWCERWNAEISHKFPKTREGKRAPLRRVDIHDLPDDVAFTSAPVFTPTFVLVNEGIELGRLEGYGGEEFFWFLPGRLLNEHPDATRPGT